MGARCFGSTSASSLGVVTADTNPNPFNYEIVKTYFGPSGGAFALLIKYPNCNNYEGNKILVYAGVNLETLKAQGSIDPHFSDDVNYISPIARFEPTEQGWILACKLAASL